MVHESCESGRLLVEAVDLRVELMDHLFEENRKMHARLVELEVTVVDAEIQSKQVEKLQSDLHLANARATDALARVKFAEQQLNETLAANARHTQHVHRLEAELASMKNREEARLRGEKRQQQMDQLRRDHAEKLDKRLSLALRGQIKNHFGEAVNKENNPQQLISRPTSRTLPTSSSPCAKSELAQCIWRLMCDCHCIDFELCCKVLLEVRGGNLYTGSAHAGCSGDHGVDVRLWREDGLLEIVQCKQWRNKVGEPCIRDFLGTMTSESAAKGYFITTSSFTRQAMAYAAKFRSIVLWGGKDVLEVLGSMGEKQLARAWEKLGRGKAGVSSAPDRLGGLKTEVEEVNSRGRDGGTAGAGHLLGEIGGRYGPNSNNAAMSKSEPGPAATSTPPSSPAKGTTTAVASAPAPVQPRTTLDCSASAAAPISSPGLSAHPLFSASFATPTRVATLEGSKSKDAKGSTAKKRVPFSIEEDNALEEGVSLFGAGSWKQIFDWGAVGGGSSSRVIDGCDSGSGSGSLWKRRDAGALKDRWRNMERAKARLRKQQLQWEESKNGPAFSQTQTDGDGASERELASEMACLNLNMNIQ